MDIERAPYDTNGRLPTLVEFRKWLDAKTEARRRPPESPGRQWLRDIPGPDGMRVFIVQRRFTADDDTVASRDEIILPGLGFWETRPLRMILFNDGYLEPLTEDTLAWQCPHGRFWATREAIEAHGCCEHPGEADPPLQVRRQAGRHFKIRGIDDLDESDRILRLVLELTSLGHSSRTIGIRLGPETGASDIADGTVRSWQREARRMRAEGLI